MKEAIELAIEGGYEIQRAKLFGFDTLVNPLLDPLFWQALGKAMGRGSGCNICLKDGITHGYENGWADECKNPREHLTSNHKYPWQIEWHRFIDHLASGGTVDEFFEDLLIRNK